MDQERPSDRTGGLGREDAALLQLAVCDARSTHLTPITSKKDNRRFFKDFGAEYVKDDWLEAEIK